MCARGGGGLLRERMALTARLWDAGVRAELLPAATPSLTAQYEYAHARGIAWLAILAADTLHAADTVRVGGPGTPCGHSAAASTLRLSWAEVGLCKALMIDASGCWCADGGRRKSHMA